MWNDIRQIRSNAARNKIEFAADGRDWRNCKEEDEMLTLAGELVHPVTYLSYQRYNQQRLFRRLREEKQKESSSSSAEQSASGTHHVISRVTSDSVSRMGTLCPGPPYAIRSSMDSCLYPPITKITKNHSIRLLRQDQNTVQLHKDPKTVAIKVQRSRKCNAHKRSTLLRPGKRAVLLS